MPLLISLSIVLLGVTFFYIRLQTELFIRWNYFRWQEFTTNLLLELLNGQRTVHKSLETLLSSALQIEVHLVV